MQWLWVVPFAFKETVEQENIHAYIVLPQGYKIYYWNLPSLKFSFDLQLYYTAAGQTSNSNCSGQEKPDS